MVHRQNEPSGALSSIFRGPRAGQAICLVLVPLLLLYSLWLPPVRLGARLFKTHYAAITAKKGGVVPGPAGAALVVPPNAVTGTSRVAMGTIAMADLVAGKSATAQMYPAGGGSGSLARLPVGDAALEAVQALPDGMVVQDPIYRFDRRGAEPQSGQLILPVPYELGALWQADLYGWNGSAWEWIPGQVSADGLTITGQVQGLPEMVILAEAQPVVARVGLDVTTDGATLPIDVTPDVLTLTGLTLSPDGGVAGQARSAASTGNAQVLVSISNRLDGVLRTDLVDNLIIAPDVRTQHVQSIVEKAQAGGYAGVELAYSGVDAGLRDEYTRLVADLADALHAAEMSLAVRVDAPTRGAEGWSTGAYDWTALGRVADWVRIPALVDPAAYAPDGDMEQMLAYATTRVSRRKIDLVIPACSYLVGGDAIQEVSYNQALGLLAGRLQADDSDGKLLPGESLAVRVADLDAAPVRLDPHAQVYSLTFQDGGAQRTVWLEGASAVTRKLQLATRHALGGVSLEGALSPDNDSRVIQAIAAFEGQIAPPEPRFAVVWTVEDAGGKVVDRAVAPIEDARMQWVAPEAPGEYVIKAAVSDDGGETEMGSASEVSVLVPSATPSPTVTPTNTPTPTPPATNTPTPAPTNTPAPTQDPATAPTAPPAPPAAPPPGNVPGYGGYGIQADLLTDGDHARLFDHLRTLRIGWIKQQVEWFRYNPAPGQYDWGGLDRIVDSANANGVHVLFSVVKAPGWARPPGDTDQGPPADPNTYGTFLREMAARYKGRVKAYEIWNEQNLYYEWGGRGGKLNAAKYVELLRVAYSAIKSVDPGATVISGALTPTGWNDGDVAIDDRLYLEQMYQAGLARYCDAVGAHPSGYNNPFDADWRTWSDPSAPGFKGHPSMFFRGTMESYRNIMVKYGDGNKRIWPTEFGWASVEGLGVAPAAGYEYAANNTEEEQARWIAGAFQWGAARSWVGTMFLWNLNFAPICGPQDEKAAFGIVRHDWSPRPAYAALAHR